ncbi:MAG: tetratricopeptide repeat protein [Spirochaetaceae bacterium]|jgi:tetratricopeptide (TPR) repeat protein|nr:tetratricopeptide repeat protein [Spirochaetaceae bacterium]
MKQKVIFQVLMILPVFMMGSCAARKVDEDTLLLYARSQAVYGEGRFEELISLLSGERSFPPALVLRGKAEYFSGDSKAAEGTFRRALLIRPSSVEASLYLARLLREKDEPEKAEGIIKTLLEDDPVNIRALRLGAEIYRGKGPAGEGTAAALLDRAVEASAETALVFVDRARFRWIEGNGEGALQDLRSAKSLLPWDTPLFRSIENLESAIREAR